MERLTGNQAKSLMEAYAQVYAPSQSGKQLLSEQQTQLPSWLNGMSIDEFNKKHIEKYRSGVYKPPLKPGETPYDRQMALDRQDVEQFGSTASGEPADKVRARTAQTTPARPAPARPAPASAKTFKVGDKQLTKAQINTEYQRLRSSKDPKERARAEQFGKDANRAIFKPATATTAGGTKFERRTPTSAELAAAKKAGGGEAGIKAATSIPKPATATPTTSTSNSNNGDISAKLNQSFQNRPGVSQSNIDFMNKQSPSEVARLNSRYNTNFTPNTQQVNNLKSKIDQVRSAITANSTPAITTAGNTAAKELSGANALKKPKPAVQTQSLDLFDIIKGEFLEEGYSEEDTMYMMANLNEEQLQEFWRSLGAAALKQANKIPGVKGLVSKVGRMFGRTPAPTRIGSGDIAALRLHQNKAHQSLQRLNQQSTRLNASDARRTAAAADPTRSRLNSDPKLISDRNAREAAAQVRQRNRELGRPEWAGPQPVDSLNYKPGDPKFTKSLQQYYADKRAGVKGLD